MTQWEKVFKGIKGLILKPSWASNTNAAIYWKEPLDSSSLPLITLPNKTFKMEISATPFRA